MVGITAVYCDVEGPPAVYTRRAGERAGTTRFLEIFGTGGRWRRTSEASILAFGQ